MSVNLNTQRQLNAQSSQFVERKLSSRVLDVVKKLLITALPLIALANLPVADAGPISYKMCLAAQGANPLSFLVCLPVLGPWCP